jgi:D-alanyl-D-alanine carboxypeptidase/D-alanyl-D-alanine-endopeptidase (penicillin-binding protein 4)
VLAAVVVLVVAAGLVLVVRPGPVERWLADPRPTPSAVPTSADPVPPPVLAAAGTGDAGPTAAGVRAAVAPLIADSGLGGRMNVSVADVASAQPLYRTHEDDLTVPASTTKLVTAAAVLASRGAAHRITTRAVAGDEPGEVVIVGAGDPTLGVNGRSAYPGVARLDKLADQVEKAVGEAGVRPAKVVVDGSLFTGPTLGPAWDDDVVRGGHASPITALMVDAGRLRPVLSGGPDKRTTRPDTAAGVAFAKHLGLDGDAVVAGTAPEPAATGPTADATAGGAQPAAGWVPGAELGRVDSPPMVRLVEWMLQASDNVIGEALARQVALARGQPASFAGGAAAVDRVVGELGLDAAESDLKDGSGLSRASRITPSLLTDVLALAASGSRPELTGMFAGLPVAGWSGTLVGRFVAAERNAAGQGVVRAKTGTLAGVSSLSGVVATKSGHLLAFAIMADGLTADGPVARRALDGIVTRLAACGCR